MALPALCGTGEFANTPHSADNTSFGIANCHQRPKYLETIEVLPFSAEHYSVIEKLPSGMVKGSHLDLIDLEQTVYGK
jgi:hypothetical protein